MSERKKILIIEDDFSFAKELEDCLTKGGYHVLPIVDNVEDALNTIDKLQPDGIVLDIQLKGELGLEVLKYLKPELDSEGDPVLIVVTSYISKRVVAFLNTKKCFYLEKGHRYKHELVLAYFNDMIGIKQEMNCSFEENKRDRDKYSTTKVLLPDGALKQMIHEKLNMFGFDSKKRAYGYLVNALFHLLNDINQPEGKSLTTIFKEVAFVQYSSIFNGINRLITTTFNKNPELFFELYYGTPVLETHLEKPIEKMIPSVKDFLYHISNEIKIEFISCS
ncbi:MAG: response regulator [Defluviitaleaceae bacterium]|nr:response regulator [Defluviitaleaceae bacterium]